MENEPSLDQIDDYNNNESPEKRKTIKLVILFILGANLGSFILRLLIENSNSIKYSSSSSSLRSNVRTHKCETLSIVYES